MPEAIPTPAAPAAAPAPAPVQNEPLNDAFATLDGLLNEPEAPKEPVAKHDKAPEPPDKPDESLESKPETKPETKPEKMAPKQLREAYESLKAKHSALETEHQTLRKTSSQPKDDPEKKEFAERAERYSKRSQDLENELKFAKYERSEEYQEKYYKPYEEAFGSGRSEAAAIKITDAEGNVRQGTPEDFDTYMFIADPETAADYAEKVFGKHKSTMEYWRHKTRELGAKSQNAIEEYRKKGSEREKDWADQQGKAQKAMSEYWSTLNKNALEKYPALFKAADEDSKGQELLTKGFTLADRAFSDGKPLNEGDKPLNPAELMSIRSAIRNKAAAFDYQLYLRRKAEAEVKSLKAELEEYKNTEPKGGDGGGKQLEAGEDWESKLNALAV